MLGRGHDLIVNIVGESSGLTRAYDAAGRKTTEYVTRSQRAGQRLRSKGLFAMQAAGALGLQQHIDVAAETIAGKLGLGSTAASALGSSTELMTDLAIESKGVRTALGKAGVAGAAGLAAYEITKMTLKATGLDKKLAGLGATAYDTAANLGLVHDPGEQFKGKDMPTQATARAFRSQARSLIAGGLTPQQAVDRIAAANPNAARRDIEVYAGVRGTPLVVNVQMDGKTVGRAVTTVQHRAASHSARQTSGRHG